MTFMTRIMDADRVCKRKSQCIKCLEHCWTLKLTTGKDFCCAVFVRKQESVCCTINTERLMCSDSKEAFQLKS